MGDVAVVVVVVGVDGDDRLLGESLAVVVVGAAGDAGTVASCGSFG